MNTEWLTPFPDPNARQRERVWYHDFDTADLSNTTHGVPLLFKDADITWRGGTYASHQVGNVALSHVLVGGRATSELTTSAEARFRIYPNQMIARLPTVDFIRMSCRTEIPGEYAGAFVMLGAGADSSRIVFGEWSAAGGAFNTSTQGMFGFYCDQVDRLDVRIGVAAPRRRYSIVDIYALGQFRGTVYEEATLTVDAPKLHSATLEITLAAAAKANPIDVDSMEFWV